MQWCKKFAGRLVSGRLWQPRTERERGADWVLVNSWLAEARSDDQDGRGIGFSLNSLLRRDERKVWLLSAGLASAVSSDICPLFFFFLQYLKKIPAFSLWHGACWDGATLLWAHIPDAVIPAFPHSAPAVFYHQPAWFMLAFSSSINRVRVRTNAF